jgi:hypothetical protein
MSEPTATLPEISPERALSKVVDLRLPLPWLITGCGTLLWSLISMYFSLNQIKEDMTALKAASVVMTAASGEMALVKFRLTSVESDLAQLKQRPSK